MEINRFVGDYSFLSNFYACKILHNRIEYSSVENFYVAMKSNSNQIIDNITYTDLEFKKYISNIESPSKVKKIGKNIVIRFDWDSIKDNIMYYGLTQKFKDDELMDKLISTKDSKLIEGNLWHDNYWGSCFCEKCGYKGKNKLGKLLMIIRDKNNLFF
jgi:ribA/ribD-fused uncharacterized protein